MSFHCWQSEQHKNTASKPVPCFPGHTQSLHEISTTALLSQWNSIFSLAHWWLHVLTELTMANSSFHKIDWTAWAGDQWA